jgi:hypothetical protein
MRRLIALVLAVGLATVSLAIPLTQRASALGGSFDWVSRSYTGGDLNDFSNGAGGVQQGISSDGRYALFVSGATDVVPNDTNGYRDIFRRDRQTGVTTLVTLGSSGQQANGDTNEAAISGDGRYVAFTTYATNFASPDFNGDTDVFVRDMQSGTTTRVCTGQYGGFPCNSVSISRDGRYITYRVTDIFNYNGQSQVFRYDQTTGGREIVSQAPDGQTANSNGTIWTRMSADGRYVVFDSYATNLVAGDTNGKLDIFRRDMDTGEIVRVSTTASGAQANNDSEWPSVSDDGRYVVFTSTASNFAPSDTNANWDLFLKDLDQGTVQTVGGALNLSQQGTVTGDGSHVIFVTSIPGFTASDTDAYQDVFSWDRAANTNARISELPGGGSLGFYGAAAGNSSIDGRYTLVFTNNMIDPSDTQPSQDVYVYDRGPSAPTNLTSTSPTMKPVLNWSAVAGATSYKVYRNGTYIATTTATTYTDTTAPNGTVSYYVTAVSNNTESSHSNTVNVVVDTVRPAMDFTAPASFATPFTTGPTVTVTASDTGSGLQTLVIHVYTSSNQLLTNCGTATPAQLSAGTMSCDLSSLPNGTYYIKAGSFDNAGNNRTINSGNFVVAH